MNKLFTKIAALALGATMAVGVGVAIGSNNEVLRAQAATGLTQTVSYTNFSGGTQSTGSSITSTNTGVISVNLSKGYKNSTYTHNYANGVITVSGDSTVTKISSVVITASSTSYTGAQSSGAYSVSTGGGSIGINSTTITYSGGTGDTAVFSHNKQLRFTEMVVTYDTSSSGGSTYTVTYNANGATSGTVPVDSNEYDSTDNTVTVLGNLGNLDRDYYDFTGWNTAEDGSGDGYVEDDTFTISNNVILYAQWEVESGYSLGTINFGSASGSTSINGQSVSGNDSASQTWSVSVSGTSSFTQNSAYSQIGSSNSPATSINFTTSFSKKMTFCHVEMKLGGFNGTTGSVAITVDSESAGSGSLNGATDVVVQSSSEEIGNVLTISISGIDKGVKAYYISYIVQEHSSASDRYITTQTDGLTLSGVTTVEAGDSAEITLITAQKKKFTNVVVTGAGTEGDNWELTGNVLYILEVTTDVTINATIVDASIVSLTVTGQKTSFARGESFTFGGTVIGTYDDNATTHGTETLIENTDFTVDSSNYVSGTDGTYSIRVSYSQTVYYDYNVTVAQVDIYQLFSGALVEGSYVIVYNGYALKAEISSNRFTNASPVISNGTITNPDASIIWRIEEYGEYWTLYNETESKYAGGTNSKNQGALLSSVTDLAKWTVESDSESTTYDFVNYGRSQMQSDSNNKFLRQNGTNGWATYASATGGEVSLYKLPETPKVISNTRIVTSGGSITADYGGDEWTVSGFVFEVQYQGESSWNAVNANIVVSESVPLSIGNTTVHIKAVYKNTDYNTGTEFTANVIDNMTPISSFYDGTITVGTTATSESYTYRGTVIAIESNTYYIQQGSYGLMIYGGNKAPATGMKVGDLVCVTSKLINFGSYVYESNSITLVDTDKTCKILGDGTLPSAPIVTTASAFNSANQSTRITFNGLSRSDTGASITWTQAWVQGNSGAHGLAKVQDGSGNEMWLYVSKYLDSTTGTAIVNKINSITTDDTFDLFQGVKAINTTNFTSIDGPAAGTPYLAIMSADNITIHTPDEDHVQTWIDTYMYMNDPRFEGDGTGLCRDSNYYVNAKAALKAVEDEHSGSIAAFRDDEGGKYTAALARYLKWAIACNDGAPFDGETTIVTPARAILPIAGAISENSNATAIVVIISVISISAIGGYFFLRKRREEN